MDTEKALTIVLLTNSPSMVQAYPSDVMSVLLKSFVERDESAWLVSFADSLGDRSSCYYEQSYDDVVNYRTINFHCVRTEGS